MPRLCLLPVCTIIIGLAAAELLEDGEEPTEGGEGPLEGGEGPLEGGVRGTAASV